MSVTGTSSSSSTEAWLVHPEPDAWLAVSAAAAATTGFGLDGVAPDASAEKGATAAGEEEASGAGEEVEGAAAAS